MEMGGELHQIVPLIRDLAIILTVASLVTLLFKKIHQPLVLGYLIAGVILGPYTPPYSFVSDRESIQIISELGVVFLMFSLGLEFGFKKLKQVGFSASVTGIVEVVFMLLLGFFAGKIVGWSFYNCLFLGAALSISSTTIIIKALDELDLKSQNFAQMVFGILIVEDLLAILLLVGLSTMVVTDEVAFSKLAWATVKLVLTIGIWFVAGYLLVPLFFRKLLRYANTESLTIATVAVCLLFVCIADYFDYSTALGAFLSGSVLSETELLPRIKQLIQPISNIFAAVFFVSIGMLIDPKIIWHNLPLVGYICVITIVGKILTSGIGALATGQSMSNSLRIGFSMAQIGEFSFIIAGLGLLLHVINDSLYSIIVAVAVITTFTTPYLIKLSCYLTKD